MSVALTIEAIQTLNLTVVGLRSAPTKRPASFNGVSLPIVLVNVGAGSFDEQASGLPRLYLGYELHFFAGAIAQGEGLDENWQKAVALFDAALAVWNAPGIDTQPGVLGASVEQIGGLGGTATPKTHSGIGKLTYAGIDYWGFTLRIPVQEKA